MSVRHSFLALLREEPMHGYQLRQEFEARTGSTWPLNIGQAYTTLARLQRDGLVEPVETDDADAPERFRLTEAGRAEADAWWLRPVERGTPARDELAIKLALAVTAPGVDVAAVVQHQRTETMRALRDYTRLKQTSRRAGGAATSDSPGSPDGPSDGPGDGAADGEGPTSGTATARRRTPGAGDPQHDLAWSLVLDSFVFGAEAEARWLDHVESKVAQAQRLAGPAGRRPDTRPPDDAPRSRTADRAGGAR